MPSRLFGTGYMSTGSAVVSAYPWTFFAWVKVSSGASGVDTIFSIWNFSSTNTGWAVESNAGKACFRSSLSGTAPTCTVATAFTAGTWQPVCAVATSATDRAIYAITTANSASSVTSNTPTSLSRTALGTRISSGVPEYNFLGQIAYATVWDAALSVDEIDALFKGAHPRYVRMGSLVSAPNIWRDSTENDLVAPRTWTVTSTTSMDDGPPVRYARRRARTTEAATSAASYLTARISSGDTYSENKFALTAADKGKMAVAIITLNDADQSISVELNERTAEATTAGGAFNAQTGNLYIGTDLVNGAAQDASTEKALVHTVRAFSGVLTAEERESVLDAIADDLTPVTTAYSGEVSSTEATDIDLTNFVKDPSGYGWSVTAAEVADEGCTAAVSGKKVTITPLGGEGTTSVTATITNTWTRPRSKSLLMSLSKVAGEEEAAPTDVPSSWTWSIPWLPTSNDDIDVYNIQTNGTLKRTVGSTTTSYAGLSGLGSNTKVALLVAPATGSITGSLACRNTRYRGVVLVGATWRYVGPNYDYWRNVTNKVRWGHVLNFSFDGAYMDERPFLFIANIDYQSTDSKGGDFFRMGTTGTNRDRWCDTYIQRVKVGVGNYFGNLDAAANKAENPAWNSNTEGPHSDFMQSGAYGEVNNFYIANCDIKWGGQIFFHRPETGDVIIGSSSDIRNVAVRPMPHDSVVQPSKPHAPYKIVDFVDGDSPSSPSAEYNAGRYHAFKFTKCFAMEDADSNATSLSSYFDSSGITPVVNATAKTVSWSSAAKSPNTLKPATGSWTFQANPADQAGTIIGSKYRITTAAALRTAAGL